MPRVLCAGHVNWDVTLHVDDLPQPDGESRVRETVQSGGGSASNVAVVLAGLDAEAALLGAVGDDEHGLLAERELRAAGVDCRHLQTASEIQTAVKYLVVDEAGEVMVLGTDGANEAYDANDLPSDTFEGTDGVHLTGQAPETAAALAERGESAGATVSFDPGRRLDERTYAPVLSAVDLLFLNRREHSLATRDGLVAEFDGTVIEKRGSDGAVVHTKVETIRHGGFEVEPIDTTGAGDAFAAGFLAAWLDGGDATEALAVGNACGALATRRDGARCYLGWEDVEPLLDLQADSD
jgi:ribokinase